MKANDAFEICAIPHQLEHNRTAEAETNRPEPLSIYLGQRCERREGGPATRTQFCGFIAKFSDQCARFLKVGRLSAITEHIGGHSHVTELRKHAGSLHGVLIEP